MDQAALAGEKAISNLKVQKWAGSPEITLGVFLKIIYDKVFRICILDVHHSWINLHFTLHRYFQSLYALLF